MDIEMIKAWFTLENIMNLIDEYRSFGPLPGILLPMLEAFLPFLPLFVFVLANVNAFGLWFGFLFSWMGASLGALIVFLLVRRYGQTRIFRVLKNNKQVHRLDKLGRPPWIWAAVFAVVLPVYAIGLVNIVAGLSGINIFQYMLAVVSRKIVMIFTISFIGHDIVSLFQQPVRTALVLAGIFVLWLAGKRVEARINKKVEKDHSRG